MKAPKDIQAMLDGFTGTENHYRINKLLFPRVFASDGVAWLCENAECYWLFDLIASYQKKCQKDEMLRDMQFWKLTVTGREAVIVCSRDEGNVAFKQKIPHTDFPLPEITIWVGRDEKGMVLYLPSEH